MAGHTSAAVSRQATPASAREDEDRDPNRHGGAGIDREVDLKGQKCMSRRQRGSGFPPTTAAALKGIPGPVDGAGAPRCVFGLEKPRRRLSSATSSPQSCRGG